MAQIYDIVNRLTNDKPVIKLAEDKEFKVNNSKNTAILIKGLSEDAKLGDIEKMDKIVEAALGREAFEYIDTLDLSINSYSIVINAIMAAISEEPLEKIEKEAAERAKKFRK